jgi:hypothetical protein
VNGQLHASEVLDRLKSSIRTVQLLVIYMTTSIVGDATERDDDDDDDAVCCRICIGSNCTSVGGGDPGSITSASTEVSAF